MASESHQPQKQEQHGQMNKPSPMSKIHSEVTSLTGSTVVQPWALIQQVYYNVKTSLENDFRVITSATSIIHQIPDVKQLENKTVVQYFSKSLKIMGELKK